MGVPVEQRAVFDVDNTGGYWLTVGLFAVELDGTFVSGRLYKKTLACQRAFSIRQKKDDSTLTVNERRRRTRHERCRCAVSILHPQSAQHPKLSSITLEHNHPIDKAEVEAKLAQKAWQAAKYQFLAAFPSPFQPWKSLEQAQLLQPPLSSQLLQPLQLLSLPHQHAKKRRISESALGIPTMGVDIRIPAGWQVESKFVQGKKCIGTHNGSFHCDEALACAMLKLLPEWSDAVVVRTRDATELAKCEVVVDVGGIYDPESLRFDHHQKIFRDTLSEESFGTRLSSAGLVYKHFGHRILKLLVEGSGIPSNMVEKKLYEKVYKNFMEHIDAIDNGVDVASGPLKYDVSSHLSARVARLNPRWNEPTDPSGPAGPNHRFMMAMSLTGGELCEYVRGLAESWWPAREIVADSLARREEYHPSREIVVLSRYCPWKGHLLELEEEMGIAGKLKFVIYAEGINADSKWRIQAIPQAEDSLTFRLSLAKPWLGLRDDELSAESNIPGCIFVHVNGFIGENATKAGALAMAIKSLEMVESTA